MGANDWMSLIQAVSVLLAIVVAVSSLRHRDNERAGTLVKMESDIDHIKKTLDCMDQLKEELTKTRLQVNAMNRRMDEHMKYDHKRP